MPPLFSAEDCLEPPDGTGELEPAVLWPGMDVDDVIEIVQGYLDDGYSRIAALPANQDEAARQWAYHRAYMRKWRERSGMPSSVQAGDQGGSGFMQGQIDSWKEMADAALAEHLRLLSARPTVAVVTHLASESRGITSVW